MFPRHTGLNCTYSCSWQHVCFVWTSQLESRGSPLWQKGLKIFCSWESGGWTRWSPVDKHAAETAEVLAEKQRKRRQRHGKRGGEPLWSPHCAVTLSPLCSCCDQRQTCMYRSTDGASHYPSHNYTPFPAPKPPSRAPCIKEELYLWTWTLSVRHKIWNPDFCFKLSFILNGILGTGGGLLSWGDE